MYLVLLAGCQASLDAPCQLGLATDIPFAVQQGHLLIRPLLNGQATDMWLDTGAQLTTLTVQAARRLSLRLEPLGGYSEGIGGSVENYGFIAHSLKLGRLQGHNFQLLAADLGIAHAGGAVDGLLGADFLAAYDVDINVAARRVSLYGTNHACGRPTAPLSGNLYVVPMTEGDRTSSHSPHVQVEIAGKVLTAVLDTGAPHTVLFSDTARRIGLDFASFAKDPHFRGSGVGPETRALVRHVLTPVTIGEITVSNLPVAIIDQRSFNSVDMLLGMDFMSRVHTWLSFSSRSVILQYPPVP